MVADLGSLIVYKLICREGEQNENIINNIHNSIILKNVLSNNA